MHTQITARECTAIASSVGPLISVSRDLPLTSRPADAADERANLTLNALHMETRDEQLTGRLLTMMSQLVETMADALGKDRETAQDCVRHACSVLLSCAQSGNQGSMIECDAPRAFRGGLAPWQVRSLTAHIDANLHTSLQCESLARLAGLSVSHFARAFKDTFGFSPHMFLMRRRLERAQGLMLETKGPLAQIASECGFADQAHFSRTFMQLTGESPGSWRRARASEPG
jgi:AraC family transcriptional regulator